MRLRFLLPAATAIAFAAPVFAQQSAQPAPGEGMRRMEQAREHMMDRGDHPARECCAKQHMHGGGGDMHEMMHMMMMHQMMRGMMRDDDDNVADCPFRDRLRMRERRGMMDGSGAPGPRPGMGAMQGRGQMRAEMAAQLEEMRQQIARMQEMIEAMAAEEEQSTEPKE